MVSLRSGIVVYTFFVSMATESVLVCMDSVYGQVLQY